MGKIPVIIRSIALVCLAALLFTVGGMGMTDSSNPVLLAFALGALLYFLLELCAIAYRLLRFRKIDDPEKQLKYVIYTQNHQLEFKVVAILRRFALAGAIALVVSLFVKHPSIGFLSGIKLAGLSIADIAKGYTQSSMLLLPTLLIMTFVKSWYVMHTSWGGSQSTSSIFVKYVSQDFAVPENVVELALYVAAIACGVIGFLAL